MDGTQIASSPAQAEALRAEATLQRKVVANPRSADRLEPRRFAGATVLITGGTGSFGSTILKHFLTLPVAEVRVVSRDEKKQEDQRQRFADGRIKHHVADV